ncbi:MAG: hypothetical protein EZS28_002250 [Streblomastix strix]|uniref:Uncharacterized protein n=1 Tax=Streblomastix strix TaxID=222440 RepID=A0A5J4X5F1_9EUKA|nr:MAG: hypothetical protein EZS28_002250 [Streblomastix strix]
MNDLPKENKRIKQIQDSQEQHQDSEENVKQQNITIQPWVYDFISNTPKSQEETQRTQLLDAITKVFVKFFKQKQIVIDPTSERANKLERDSFLERDEDIVSPELNEKEVIGCSGENDLEIEVGTQRFAVPAQHACVAAETALIFSDIREATRQILTARNATRIIARDSQQMREVALVADQFKDILGKNASVYKVLGEQSKQAIRESAKTAKILAESQKPIDPKQLSIQQQSQAIQTMFPNLYSQYSGIQFGAGRGQEEQIWENCVLITWKLLSTTGIHSTSSIPLSVITALAITATPSLTTDSIQSILISVPIELKASSRSSPSIKFQQLIEYTSIIPAYTATTVVNYSMNRVESGGGPAAAM